MAPAERLGPPDEKVTINVGPVDLGKIDLLVSEGLYASRTDLIREAIRRQLERHARVVEELVTRRELTVGFTYYSRKDFERFREKGQRIRMRIVGMAKLANDITPELADAVIEDISVLGSLRASKPVLEMFKARRAGEEAAS